MISPTIHLVDDRTNRQLMPGDQHPRVLIADPDGLARRMMQNALQEADGVVALPTGRDAREALELPPHRPHSRHGAGPRGLRRADPQGAPSSA